MVLQDGSMDVGTSITACGMKNSFSHVIPNFALGVVLFLFGSFQQSSADVMEFTESALWEEASGEFETIGYTEYPWGMIITDEYADRGVIFTDGNDMADFSVEAYPIDMRGLSGGQTPVLDLPIRMSFIQPYYSIAVDFPGGAQFLLYWQDEEIYRSSEFGGIGAGFFAGLVSTQPFDRAVVFDWQGSDVAIDDLHFGVPAPGVIPLLALAALWPRYRRRRQ